MMEERFLNVLGDQEVLFDAYAASSAYVLHKAFEGIEQLQAFRGRKELAPLLVEHIDAMADEPADPIVFGAHLYALSLALHLLNAGLAGWLAHRLTEDQRRRAKDQVPNLSSFIFRPWSALVAGAIVALHPAPFEAAVWISAQSELLAAALLLAALHLWLTGPTTNDKRPSIRERASPGPWSLVIRPWSIGATLALSLALLAKESAAIGLPLLMLLDRSNVQTLKRSNVGRFALPTLVTLAYVALQVSVERRNYLLAQGGYGLGPQLILNPLRSLALIVAPLPGTEHANNAWLVPFGALVALGLSWWTDRVVD